jgi:hypothetical protein
MKKPTVSPIRRKKDRVGFKAQMGSNKLKLELPVETQKPAEEAR